MAIGERTPTGAGKANFATVNHLLINALVLDDDTLGPVPVQVAAAGVKASSKAVGT